MKEIIVNWITLYNQGVILQYSNKNNYEYEIMHDFCFYIEYIQTTLTTHILVLKTQIET